tara:strand:- start:1884 stop:2186 length:303 start_codon:yes stop_codon:yes gene_type:complete
MKNYAKKQIKGFGLPSNHYPIAYVNKELKYAISVCNGKGLKAPYHVKLTILLNFKEWFSECGFSYQSKILDFWINRFRRDHNLQISERNLTNTIKEGIPC